MTAYAELQATSNFSFLRGASHAKELMVMAEAYGLKALGVTDRNTLAGVVRPWTFAKDEGLKARALTGCRLDFADETPSLLCYPTDREAFGRLTRLLTVGQLRGEKGECHLFWEDFLQHAEGQLALIVPPAQLDEAFEGHLKQMAGELHGRIWLTANRAYAAQDLKRLARLSDLARDARAPMVATNNVLYHAPERRVLQDVMTCIREGCTIQEAGLRLEANAERHLKRPTEMARLFERWPQAVERTLEIVERIDFDLGQLRYEYPDEPVPPGSTAIRHLTKLAWDGAKTRYPGGVDDKVKNAIKSELKLIKKLNVPNYFLTVHDIVKWARGQGILCQGRGSAANSSVCFCLGVTAVDPTKPNQDLLFARFLSEERGEPPDIDVDFEHDRREEVMQYVYRRYGRHRAAICATVIHYRPRSAIRDVGKALGLTEDITAQLANTVWGSWGDGLPEAHIRQVGLDPENPAIKRAVLLATELLEFPRHLSQHVGGFVLTQRRLDETVPIGNAAMVDRTFIEWDKDDIDSVGLMKVDVLALGMLSAVRRAFDMLRADHGLPLSDLADIPQEQDEVYAMLQKADSVGVFQVESRAQMSMLPRLKPKDFYDLAIQVAIVRPGPIQGNMVHPYLKRRANPDLVTYPRPASIYPQDELVDVLGKTLGVPLFQEQAMRIAIEGAKFSDADANGLRRCMATFRSQGDLGVYQEKFVGGMIDRGYDPTFAKDCFEQIKGFGSYGFPESHAVSFALLVYASAWIKCSWPDVFCAALINSQPMGFYQPAQLVRDAREHGVKVLAPDVLMSDWDCTLEPSGPVIPDEAQRRSGAELERGAQALVPDLRAARFVRDDTGFRPAADKISNEDMRPHWKAVRLGFRQIKGLRKSKDKDGDHDDIDLLMAARAAGARAPVDFARAGVSQRALELLAEADAFASTGLSRRDALWAVKGLKGEVKVDRQAQLLAGLPLFEDAVALPVMGMPQQVAEDYRTTSLSLKAHPCGFFRPSLERMGVITADQLKGLPNGRKVKVAGLVLVRQRPGTAKGVVFLTLEDETGVANAVVWKDCFDTHRRTVMSASFLVVHGKVQTAEGVIHLVAERFTDLSPQLARIKEAPEAPAPTVRMRTSGRLQRSRDFH